MKNAGSRQRITARILGCGSSGGVPRIGGNWGDCDPENPKNRRTRCALLIQATNTETGGQTNIVIDTGCDIREQLLLAGISGVDAVFYTHEHADHTHGIDDLRVLALNERRRVDVYANGQTLERLNAAFGYCFQAPPGSPYPPILNAHEISHGDKIAVEGEGGLVTLTAFDQVHGDIMSLGYRIGNLAYSCDLSDVPDKSLSFLAELDIWIVDALRYKSHPSHFSVKDCLAWIEKIKPQKAYCTNMHIDLDYDRLADETPDNVVPCFDGLELAVA